MPTLMITLTDDRMQQLEALAQGYQISLEELLRLAVEAVFDRPDDDFRSALRLVLDKNSDLYKRLS